MKPAASRRVIATSPGCTIEPTAAAAAAPVKAKSSTAAAAAERHFCVVLHDVAPARWAGCVRVLTQLEQLAQEAGVALPLTLLVVPRMHGQQHMPAAFLRWLKRLSRGGHELALHGLTHRDEAPAATGLAEHAMRRWYTAGEGEFASLDRSSAEARLAAGRAWAAGHGLPMQGFVAPAWLLSEPAWEAVQAAGFDYTCTLTRVVALPGRERLEARSMVFSTRSAWRRVVSVLWNGCLARHQRNAPLLRFELHPGDADDAAVRRCWSRVLAQALRERQPLRLAEVAERLARHPGAASARAAA